MEQRVFCLKMHSGGASRFCMLCAARTNPPIGLALFVEGTWSPICAACGHEHAPQLTALLALSSQLEAGATVAAPALATTQW